ncbi:hypothetical protein U0070_003578 [Myodes glareolus]|uniref:Uncharacterized protein n=1 Tax=Myodes glareolus TaxID=447135 RepID=A0AAW0J0D7_MYOGA
MKGNQDIDQENSQANLMRHQATFLIMKVFGIMDNTRRNLANHFKIKLSNMVSEEHGTAVPHNRQKIKSCQRHDSGSPAHRASL